MRVNILQLAVGFCLGKVHYKRFAKNKDICSVVYESVLLKYSLLDGYPEDKVLSVTKPAVVSAPYDVQFTNSSDKVIEAFSKSLDALNGFVQERCRLRSRRTKRSTAEPNHEVRKLVSSGDAKNRIDVVFMGDGYTREEKDKFFADITRLTKEMFEGITFRSWLPLFNIWAVYVESAESGIGYDEPKDTPFQLHRSKGQLRGIFTKNRSYARWICSLTGEGGCDYPALIGNDDFYGGTGGEFVITTSSNKSGTINLRHELGHNFARVGEEYDSGYAYSGVNVAHSLSNIGWENWLTGPIREERAMHRILEYPWHDLRKNPCTFTFTSDGQYSRWQLKLSVTAAEQEDSVEFLLDGIHLPWKPKGSVDREFYEWQGKTGFGAGNHTFEVRSLKPTTNKKIPQMISHVTLHELGNEEEFNTDNEHYSAYPTWDYLNRKSYRPTNEKCLMRNMTSNTFCHVCKEGIWEKLLRRISLVDSLDLKNNSIVLTTPKLGQFREGDKITGENLSITWKLNNSIVSYFDGQLAIHSPAKGSWTATVEFTSPEIRTKSPYWAKDRQTIEII